MATDRIVPNRSAENAGAGAAFFTEVLGLEVAMSLPFITTYHGDRGAQISVIAGDPSGLNPDYSVGVDDLDRCHARAVAQGLAILYGPVDEPWGVRRFFVRDPLNGIANIVQHRK